MIFHMIFLDISLLLSIFGDDSPKIIYDWSTVWRHTQKNAKKPRFLALLSRSIAVSLRPGKRALCCPRPVRRFGKRPGQPIGFNSYEKLIYKFVFQLILSIFVTAFFKTSHGLWCLNQMLGLNVQLYSSLDGFSTVEFINPAASLMIQHMKVSKVIGVPPVIIHL